VGLNKTVPRTADRVGGAAVVVVDPGRVDVVVVDGGMTRVVGGVDVVPWEPPPDTIVDDEVPLPVPVVGGVELPVGVPPGEFAVWPPATTRREDESGDRPIPLARRATTTTTALAVAASDAT
jgi:hypothetical protein